MQDMIWLSIFCVPRITFKIIPFLSFKEKLFWVYKRPKWTSCCTLRVIKRFTYIIKFQNQYKKNPIHSAFKFSFFKPCFKRIDIAVTSNKKYWNLGVFNLLSHLRLRHHSKLPPHNHHQLLLDDHQGNTHRETKTFVR